MEFKALLVDDHDAFRTLSCHAAQSDQSARNAWELPEDGVTGDAMVRRNRNRFSLTARILRATGGSAP